MSGASPSTAGARELRSVIDQALVNYQVPTASTPIALPAGNADFCGLWPGAKPLLQGLAGVVVFLPGFGHAAGAALTALIAVGDTVYKQTCSTPPGAIP